VPLVASCRGGILADLLEFRDGGLGFSRRFFGLFESFRARNTCGIGRGRFDGVFLLGGCSHVEPLTRIVLAQSNQRRSLASCPQSETAARKILLENKLSGRQVTCVAARLNAVPLFFWIVS
jgi:hypothetical protein